MASQGVREKTASRFSNIAFSPKQSDDEMFVSPVLNVEDEVGPPAYQPFLTVDDEERDAAEELAATRAHVKKVSHNLYMAQKKNREAPDSGLVHRVHMKQPGVPKTKRPASEMVKDSKIPVPPEILLQQVLKSQAVKPSGGSALLQKLKGRTARAQAQREAQPVNEKTGLPPKPMVLNNVAPITASPVQEGVSERRTLEQAEAELKEMRERVEMAEADVDLMDAQLRHARHFATADSKGNDITVEEYETLTSPWVTILCVSIAALTIGFLWMWIRHRRAKKAAQAASAAQNSGPDALSIPDLGLDGNSVSMAGGDIGAFWESL